MNNNIFQQNCGDSLKIIEEAYKKNGYVYYKCQFLKYPCEVYALLGNIKKGSVVNPQIEQVEFINKIWHQNCGDDLKVIRKSNQCNSDGISLFECEFIKYPYKILARKEHIKKGVITNPQIEIEEFVKKEWNQKCGDSLKIIKKTDKKEGSNFLYECEFIKYPCKVLALKDRILKGNIINPQIEQINFTDKIWPQNCGDILKVIKSEKKGMWLCEFIKYPCKLICSKQHILLGNVDNPNLPLSSKETFFNYLKKYQEKNKKKITIEKICEEFNRAKSTILSKIYEFEAYEYIDYNWYISSIPEEEVRDYCRSLDISFLEKSTCQELNGKEIDIYSPKLKLGIEFNGDYWHSDKIVLKNKGIPSKEADLNKYNLAKSKGIDLYFIWEHDWKGRQEVVKRYLRILISKYR